MQKVRMTSRKYDGRLRDEYAAFLWAEDPERLVVYAPVGTLSYDRRTQAWIPAPDGLLEIYFKHRWYNVWHICEQVSGINRIYAHIAMPATLREMRLEWTDLDLDYRVHLDDAVEPLDRAEFEQNARRWGYPRHVLEQAQAACRDVEAGIKSRTFPFDHERQVELYNRLKRSLLLAKGS